MIRVRRVLIVPLFLLLVVSSIPLAKAQETGLELAAWGIEVWPEYDKPSVLVIYNGTVADSTALPQTVRVPVPAGVTINAVADVDATGNLMSVPWRSEDTAQGQDVVFALDSPRFVVEYYADVLSDPPAQAFDLSLVAPYAARQASLSLRQPARASDLKTTPDLAQTGLDELGNPLYGQSLGPLTAGQEIRLGVSYTKPDARPSIAAATDSVPAESSPQNRTSSNGSTDWLPWLIGALILVLAAAVAVFLFLQWQQRQVERSRQVRRRQARERGLGAPVAKTTTASPDNAGHNVFCPQCGRRYDPSDRFCRSCGTPRH